MVEVWLWEAYTGGFSFIGNILFLKLGDGHIFTVLCSLHYCICPLYFRTYLYIQIYLYIIYTKYKNICMYFIYIITFLA